MNYDIMTLEHSNMQLLWGAQLPTSGLVVFGPLSAQISIHSAKKIKQNLQAWIGQNSIKDIFNTLQVLSQSFPAPAYSACQ